jgi:hypothetical protein
VCARCAESIDETHRMDAIIWKDLRISAFLQNRLIPYFHPTVDRGVDKVYRYVPSMVLEIPARHKTHSELSIM